MRRIVVVGFALLFTCFVMPSVGMCSDLYRKVNDLMSVEKYDDIIDILTTPCSEDPLNLRLNILLATAQVEKCALLKNAGDERYKTLVMAPYRTAVRLHKALSGHPELYYISAKCLWINDSRYRAKKTINKALKMDVDNVKYLILKGDICCDIGGRGTDEGFVDSAFDDAQKAYEKALLLKNDNSIKREIEVKLVDALRKKAARLKILSALDQR